MDRESVILALRLKLQCGAVCQNQDMQDLEDLQDWDDAVDVCPTLWILDQVSVVDRIGFFRILLI